MTRLGKYKNDSTPIESEFAATRNDSSLAGSGFHPTLTDASPVVFAQPLARFAVARHVTIGQDGAQSLAASAFQRRGNPGTRYARAVVAFVGMIRAVRVSVAKLLERDAFGRVVFAVVTHPVAIHGA